MGAIVFRGVFIGAGGYIVEALPLGVIHFWGSVGLYRHKAVQ